MLELFPETFKNKKEKNRYIILLKDELLAVKQIFSEKPQLKKSTEGRGVRVWERRCKEKLKELQENKK